MPRGRQLQPPVLSEGQERRLRSISRSTSMPHGPGRCARIVLTRAKGPPDASGRGQSGPSGSPRPSGGNGERDRRGTYPEGGQTLAVARHLAIRPDAGTNIRESGYGERTMPDLRFDVQSRAREGFFTLSTGSSPKPISVSIGRRRPRRPLRTGQRHLDDIGRHHVDAWFFRTPAYGHAGHTIA